MHAQPPAAGPPTPAGRPFRPEPGLAEAAAAYLSARIELVRLEAREAAGHAVRRGMLAGLLAGCAVFAWALLVASLIGLLGGSITLGGRPVGWHWIAMTLGGLHLCAAAVIGMRLARPAPPTFAATRAELETDRQWLADLKRQLGSKH